MRDLDDLELFRIRANGFQLPDTMRAYLVPACKRMFRVIVSIDPDPRCGMLEHVSVSHRRENIIPTWEEMCAIKDLFFYPEEEVVQIHPKHSEYVNLKKNCLHLWRPVSGKIFGECDSNES